MAQNNSPTLKDIYSITNRTEDKLDSFRREMTADFENNRQRITVLEIWKANLMGKVSLLVAILSLVFASIWSFLIKRIEL